MRHIDLFSGIGGFALAAREVWGDEYEDVLFCDNNKFCQEVLKKNFGKGSVIYGDIREVERDKVAADAVDILTGGFPCQPFSAAGKRRGTEDNRYLWPEMLRVIKDFSPRWVIAENVRGLINISDGVVFEQVCSDLEGAGYEVQPLVIPAVAVNAPHRRDRVWFVANRKSIVREWGESSRNKRWESEEKIRNKNSNAPDTGNEGLQRHEQPATLGERARTSRPTPQCSWDENWLEVATEFCGVDDGVSVELDGFKLSKSAHRIERFKALGNAIVPQVAIEIMRAIKNADVGMR